MRYYFALLIILSCLPSYGYDIVVDNFYYDVDIENQTLSFSGYSSAFNGSVIRIPPSVTYNSRVLPVVGISTNAFKRVGSLSLSVVIPNTVLEIMPEAFPYGTKVENVVIEDGDKPIKVGYAHKGALLTTGQEEGKGTFGYCSLNEVYIGRNLDFSQYNSLAYGYTPFYRSSIKKVTFGEKVTTIQASLFCFCYYLSELYLPESIQEIGRAAFMYCGFTNHFVLPPKVTVVEYRTFSASKFQVIDLSSDALTEICDEAFEGRNAGYSSYNGEYTKEIIIGKNVTKIGVAFRQQKDIKKITCYNTEPPLISHPSFVPDNVYLDAILYVPANSVELYKSAYAWKNFWNIKPIEGTSNITGDVNSDGEVNIADINAIINVILGDISNQLADVNNDGEVNIADVNMVIGIILRDTPSTPSTTQTFTVNGVKFKMVAVEGGSFTMGATSEQGNDAYNWENPINKVNLTSYRIGQTEVTQELWLAVMGNNPSGAFLEI